MHPGKPGYERKQMDERGGRDGFTVSVVMLMLFSVVFCRCVLVVVVVM